MFLSSTLFNAECFVQGKIKHPKLSLFIISVILVYILFSGLVYTPLHNILVFMGYFGTFLAGSLYPYALTSATGTGILLILRKNKTYS